eukprot:TRINITY_DN31187_c0_g1_i1.p1 TRINITY_DN31187_c0_g1~~TRINITY_DN31187_c0_g1_i1.p1  ORF type:complete len:635 (+),score=133.39 TRINITY_DN31187_c0_g1_i1:183-1907(+)
MESSTASLTFKGSIPEAIVEAKNKRKLFLVYISGQDENSLLLEQSTWKDENVAESISRHCVLLHLIAGSVDAAQFSAIYPQKSVPSISAVGYNGGAVLLHYEGYVSAEILVADIEKTWVSLHLQETAATFLTAAALASNTPAPPSSSAPNVTLIEKGSSSSSNAPTSADNPFQGSEPARLAASELEGETKVCEPIAEKCTISEETSSQSVRDNQLEFGTDELSIPPSDTADASVSPLVGDAETSEVEARFLDAQDGPIVPQVNSTLNVDYTSTLHPSDEVVTANKEEDSVKEMKSNGSVYNANEVEGNVQDKKSDGSIKVTANEMEDGAEVMKSDESVSSANISRSSDVHLNIRLPDGSSIQAKFSVTDNLRLVKDYVDENDRSGMGSYDLAIPYPRKVFSEQDMSKALSELGFVNRETLIVVPRSSVARLYKGKSSSHENTRTTAGDSDPLSNNGGGLFGYLRRILSAMNPFSYSGSTSSPSSSVSPSSNGLWEYRPNPGLQSSLAGRPYNPRSPNLDSPASGENVSKDKKGTPAQFGSNIHTLKHDEDDGPFGDRNAFWNGNSTQYGGDNNK